MVESSSKEEATIHNKELQHITALRTNFGQLLPLNSGVLCCDFRFILLEQIIFSLLSLDGLHKANIVVNGSLKI
jgi:hypothetical protein